jgi:putative SOS response-associated peptidase YedK
MCGRYSLTSPVESLVNLFDAGPLGDYHPRYNIAPSQSVPVVRFDEDGERAWAWLKWGLIPSWAKDPAIGNRMINARSETVSEKPSFRAAFRRRRCLIPADGFYEWQSRDGAKQPHLIAATDGGTLAFAGLWEHWQDQEGRVGDRGGYAAAIVRVSPRRQTGRAPCLAARQRPAKRRPGVSGAGGSALKLL